MRVEYTIIPKEKATIMGTVDSPYIFTIGDAKVTIEIVEDNIEKLKISFGGIGYTIHEFLDEKKIYLEKEELHYSAYKVCSYISNRIYTDSNIDAFDCTELIDKNSPEIYAENNEEKKDIDCCDIFRVEFFEIISKNVSTVDINSFDNGYKYEKAYTAYADGLRANSIITRYVQFYKTMEVFVNKNHKADKFDNSISDIVAVFDDSLNSDRIKELRYLRNRCEHPHQNKGHISSSDIQNIKEIEKNLPDLIKIARILFNHFKENKDGSNE